MKKQLLPPYTVKQRHAFLFLVISALVIFPAELGAQNWYRSNQSGMALERLSSRTVALHLEWSLSVESAGYAALPVLIRPYYNPSYSLEQRLLYERGTLKRRQWIFRDGAGVTRFNASLPADLSSVGKTEGGEIPPFIELFAPNRALTETRQYLPPGMYVTRYFYQEEILVRAETFLDTVPLWTDSYRYTRQTLLRGVERKYHEAGSYAEALQGTSSNLLEGNVRPSGLANVPVVPPGLDLRDAPPIPGFVSPGSPYDNSIMTDVLHSIYSIKAARVVYETDSLGRVISETRYNEEDKVLAVINNEWANDRITMINWTSPPDEGRIVFRYSGKDRIGEEDYRNGVLERRVSLAGNEEIEELFMNGKAILRAVWKDGRKISEERLR